ncbi:hypothetical protein HPP92_013364 [Vanilla planifolia]|uniref:Glutathione S-transferase n=1 Tax=Vanilla planifolia TaxID=51239 RepID=A0A835UZX6_VANPL|nr:hypothetical protein HPP92_013364 [Vanilla planifolia]
MPIPTLLFLSHLTQTTNMEEPKQPTEHKTEEQGNPSFPSSLTLLGSWASSYTHRVQLALKLKNLPFDYIEEDLVNKSPSLLTHNPVYKKVPVLLASGHPIPESLLILHFLDESFPDTYPLLPASPHHRAVARFWAYFAEDRLGPAVAAVFASSGEDQLAAVARFRDELRLLEAELSETPSSANGSSPVTASGSWTSSSGAAPTGWPSSRRSPR